MGLGCFLRFLLIRLAAGGVFLSFPFTAQGETVRVATYNVTDYVTANRDLEGEWRRDYPKPESEKAALRRVIRAVAPDIVVLQEIGGPGYLEELRRDLAAEGIEYPYGFVVEAMDRTHHQAILSKRPFEETRSHSDVPFSYFEEREKIKRGILEATFETGGRCWTVFGVDLKSGITERADDPGARKKRTAEAGAAADLILERRDPSGDAYLVVGDFNTGADSPAIRRFEEGRETTLAERLPARDSEGESWTSRRNAEGYLESSHILVSPALKPAVIHQHPEIHDDPDWRTAGDHRLVWVDIDFSLAGDD